MDSFQIKNAGSLIAANIKSDIIEIRRREERARQTQEALARSTENEQRTAQAQIAEFERQRAEELELIEDELGSSESPLYLAKNSVSENG